MNRIVKTLLAVLFVAMGTAAANAQNEVNQNQVCPGWNNPSNFSTNNSRYYYTGRGGNVEYSKQRPRANDGFTGIKWNGATWNAAALDASNPPKITSNAECTSGIPGYDQFFYIVGSTYRNGTDPNTQNHLTYFPNSFNTPGQPPRFNSVIRIGDVCYDGDYSQAESRGFGAQGLFYNMRVTPQNALLFIYYACVVQSPGHGVNSDPAFIIRVTKDPRTGSDTLYYGNQYQLSDTLTYMITSTPTSDGGDVVIQSNFNTNGWHQVGSSGYYSYDAVLYKDWSKVAINLNNYLYEDVRIEIMISDCYANYHWAYAYVAGECQPMQLRDAGCPKGLDTIVSIINAPEGLISYRWYASNWGAVSNPSADYVTWRPLTATLNAATNPSAHIYRVGPSDFRITRAVTDAGDTVTVDSICAHQHFMCEMYSSLDPSKPFASKVYLDITNNKPTMKIDSLFTCDGDILFNNVSYVPGQADRVVDTATMWYAFSNLGLNNDSVIKAQAFLADTGVATTFHFDNDRPVGILVQTNTTDSSCYSQAIYRLQPKLPPAVGFSISDKMLCDEEQTLLMDTTAGVTYREWRIVGNSHADTLRATVDDDLRQTVPELKESVNRIELYTQNRHYVLEAGDTTWCTAVAVDTVRVFLHPELEVLGDTIVCSGSTTDATVNAVGMEDCEYTWSRSLGSITGGLPAGNQLRVVPYADTATYFIRVTSPQGCVAWDSIHAYMVVPRLQMLPEDGRICPGDTAFLIGSAADHYQWTASPADPTLTDQATNAMVGVMPTRTTTYTLVGYGTNNCAASPLRTTVTPLPYPSPAFSATPPEVDADDPTVILRDVSSNSVAAHWAFTLDDAEGKEVKHTFSDAQGADSVHFVLTVANAIGCTSAKEFALPVNIYTAWLPNIFIPGSGGENAFFRLHTINTYTDFHIRIYNRQGMLVYESTDPAFSWDGKDMDGNDLPQAAYAYQMSYRKPGIGTIMSKTGTITLVR